MKIKQFLPITLLVIVSMLFSSYFFSSSKEAPLQVNAPVKKRHLNINVHTLGELEAEKSTIISSKIGNDQSKVIFLVEDGLSIKEGDLLVKIDSAAIEDKIKDLEAKLKEQEGQVLKMEKTLESEMRQKEIDKQTAQSELVLSQLEFNKLVKSEGPMETKRLKSLMDKAERKYISYQEYYQDLQELAENGYENEFESAQAVVKLEEEREAYELAQEQYELYVDTTYPILKHKAEAQLSTAQIRCSDAEDTNDFKMMQTTTMLYFSKMQYEDVKAKLKEAKEELANTEIYAPADGMIVLKEDFRSGQKRKPRIGDTLVKNQPILDLPDLSSMLVKTQVREVDLHKVQVGKLATVEVDAFPQESYKGKITFIGVLAQKDPSRTGEEKYFDIQIALDNSNQSLRPGMTSRIIIQSEEIPEALTIPYQALYETDNQTPCCYVTSRGKVEKRNIRIGTMNEQWIVVESGLKEGEQVCLTMPQKIAKTL